MRKIRMRTYSRRAMAEKYVKIFMKRAENTWMAEWNFFSEEILDEKGHRRFVIVAFHSKDRTLTPYYITRGKFNWAIREHCHIC